MSSNSINGLSSSYLQSMLDIATQSNSSTSNQTNPLAVALQQPDSGQISPFASLFTQLQNLQQTDPTKYQQTTQEIATNLQNAAQTATSQGDTAKANQLNQLATDFSTASQTGQLPNIGDVSQALGGGSHHHHHHHGGGHGASSSSSTDSTQTASQILASSTDPSNSLDPMSIIMNTIDASTTQS